MDVSRAGRVRKKSSALLDYDVSKNSEVQNDEHEIEVASEESLLKSVSSLVESNFKDSLTSTIVKTGDSLYLSIWKSPNKMTSDKRMTMKYLPLFYVICSVGTDNSILLKLITYHGKIVEELKASTNKAKVDFVGKLRNIQLCSGVSLVRGVG